MRFGALPYTLILVWMTGMGLAAMPQAQATPGAAVRPQEAKHPRMASAVDLSQKNVLVLHGLESNVPIFELTDRGIKTVLDSGGWASETSSSNTWILCATPAPFGLAQTGLF